VVCYGCASGSAPQWTWQAFVFRELKVCCMQYSRHQGTSFRAGSALIKQILGSVSSRYAVCSSRHQGTSFRAGSALIKQILGPVSSRYAV
jgi:hypothetical protein